jgi:hypothetical protein
MRAAHTCPLCLSQLVPWFLGYFKEDGQQFERILWACPKQKTRVFLYIFLLLIYFLFQIGMLLSYEYTSFGSVLDKTFA